MLAIVESRRVWSTMSKAFDRSSDIATVRCGGLGWLKPVAIWWVKGRRAVVVDLFFLKPCWASERGRWNSRKGRRSRSRTLAAGQRSEMGRYEVDSLRGLSGFGMGTIWACFHIAGMRELLREWLMRWVR